VKFDSKTFLLQTGLKSLGFDFGPPPAKYGRIDGDFGPKTQAAISAFEAAHSATPAPQGAFGSSLVDIATQELLKDVRETSKNQGAEIAKYWTATTYPNGYKNREPYCAAFVCWLFMTAAAGRKVPFTLPKSPVAYDFESWARANAGKGVTVAKTPQAGDVFTLDTASHVGLVVGVNGSTVITIEANTDGSGSREGDGVYKRSRSIASVRQFIRATV
jgi:peptidoglycan hydrolase-like protein with peptidoglycan-binding domain